jgi:hypothetical protein
MDFLLTNNNQLHTYEGFGIYNSISMNYISVDFATSNQTISTTSSDGGIYVGGAYNTIRFNNIVSDDDGCWNTETFSYTPKVPGIYLFCLNARIEATFANSFLTDVVVNIVKNGANNWHGTELLTSNTVTVETSLVSAMIEMNGTTDYVQPMVWLSTSDGNTAIVRGGVVGQQNERYSFMMARRLI